MFQAKRFATLLETVVGSIISPSPEEGKIVIATSGKDQLSMAAVRCDWIECQEELAGVPRTMTLTWVEPQSLLHHWRLSSCCGSNSA